MGWMRTSICLLAAAQALRVERESVPRDALFVRGGRSEAPQLLCHNEAQATMVNRLRDDAGFVAALDQSGGSTPKALESYGVPKEAYGSEGEMFDVVHEMRERIVTSDAFDGRVLAAILFEMTMDRTFGGLPAPEYLWKRKGVVPLLKCDLGLEAEDNGCQRMRPLPDLEATLARARGLGVAGTKMRSRILAADEAGIRAVVAQQFAYAKRILACGLLPIVEPEVDVACPDKARAEEMLLNALHEALQELGDHEAVMLKLTLPDLDGLYGSCVAHPHCLRVLALSGGYARDEANAKLKRNPGVVASFSRALMEGATRDMTDAAFDAHLEAAVASILDASTNKVDEEA